MYEIKGLRFQVSERTEENIMFTEPEVYKELRKHIIKDDIPTLNYDEVMHIFKPEHPSYGRTIKELLKEKRMNEQNIKDIKEIMKNLTLIQNYVNAWYKPINDEEYRRVYKIVNELLTDTKHKIEKRKKR